MRYTISCNTPTPDPPPSTTVHLHHHHFPADHPQPHVHPSTPSFPYATTTREATPPPTTPPTPRYPTSALAPVPHHTIPHTTRSSESSPCLPTRFPSWSTTRRCSTQVEMEIALTSAPRERRVGKRRDANQCYGDLKSQTRTRTWDFLNDTDATEKVRNPRPQNINKSTALMPSQTGSYWCTRGHQFSLHTPPGDCHYLWSSPDPPSSRAQAPRGR